MSNLSRRLRRVAQTTARDPLLSTRLEVRALRELATGTISAESRASLRAAGYLSEEGSLTEAGTWLQNAVGHPDAVALTLRWQHKSENAQVCLAELQLFIDEDLVFLLETRAVDGVQTDEALVGYASYLDLPFVMASWLNLSPGEVAPVPDREVSADEVVGLAAALPPGGLGSLSFGETALLDFAFDGERYFVLIAPENARTGRMTLASLTTSNLLQLLTAAATGANADS